MPRPLIALTLMALCAGTVAAQERTAEHVYVPMGYRGHTCTGVVTSADEVTREFTLTYEKEGEWQTFVGVLPKGYKVKVGGGGGHEVKQGELVGMRLKAYYMPKSEEANGEEVTPYEVVQIKFAPPSK